MEDVKDDASDSSNQTDSPAQVWQDFLDETSLLGIQRTFQKKSLLWMIASVLCLAMGILQSWRTAQEYFGNKSLQRLLVTNKARLPFPSVTACSDILLPESFNFTLIPGYNTSVDHIDPDSCQSEESQAAWCNNRTVHCIVVEDALGNGAELITSASMMVEDVDGSYPFLYTHESVMEKNHHYLIEYLRQLPDQKRINLSLSINQFLISCKFGSKPCNNASEKFSIFNNPFFGNCFTFNPAFDGIGVEADVGDKLVMEFKTDSSGYRLEAGKLHIPMLIHSPGSAPILSSPAVFDIQMGTQLTMSMRLSEKLFVKLASSGRHPCVPLTDINYRQKSIFFSEGSQYLYSLEACMASCEQKYDKESCNLIDATFPVQSKQYEDSVKAAIPPVPCHDIPDLDMDLCDCPLPCRVLQYSYTPDTTETPVPDCEIRRRKSGEEDENHPSIHIRHFDHHNSKVTIFFASNIYDTTTEELQHSFSQFLGILGGNISLWAGICVLSLLEVVDLLINILTAACKKRKKGTSSNKKTNFVDLANSPNCAQTLGGPSQLRRQRMRGSPSVYATPKTLMNI